MNCAYCRDMGITAAGACFDSTVRAYRYALWRRWGPEPPILFVMLNPSIADASIEDPTVRRVRGYAQRWGFGGYIVCNAFARVSTDPAALYAGAKSPVGVHNDVHIAHALTVAPKAIVAWGSHLEHRRLQFRVAGLKSVIGDRAEALALTSAGSPKHPLYLAGNLVPQPFQWNA